MADTGWVHPTVGVASMDWSGASDACVDNTSAATPSAITHENDWTTFKNAAETSSLLDLLPSDLTSIDGIEIRLRLYEEVAASNAHCECTLSWDGRTTFTTAGATSGRVPSSGAILNESPGQNYTGGGASDTHGRSWARSEFSDANFAIKLVAQGSYADHACEFIEVKVHYTPAGGGSIPVFKNYYGQLNG